MDLFKYPIVILGLVISILLMSVSVVFSVLMPTNQIAVIAAVLMSQAASSIFFPILVGYFYDKLKAKESGDTIWNIFKDFADGGIERVYKDREESKNPDNALNELRQAFLQHKKGDVKLIGVSLRVFFNPPGPFYQAITGLALEAQQTKESDQSKKVKIKVLISHPESPEVINRAKIETPKMLNDQLIKRDIALTVANIEHLRRTYESVNLEHRYYMQAPYCTLVLFPDKCFFSPNLLSNLVPVRLPMIIFRKDSHGYQVLNEYFEFIWDNCEKISTNNEPKDTSKEKS